MRLTLTRENGNLVRLCAQGSYLPEIRSKISKISPELAFNFAVRGKSKVFDQITELFKHDSKFYVVGDATKTVITKADESAPSKTQRHWIIALQVLHTKYGLCGPSSVGFEIGKGPKQVDPKIAKSLIKTKWARISHSNEKYILTPGPRICE